MTIEDKNIDSSHVTIEYSDDSGVLKRLVSPIESLEIFLEETGRLDWSHRIWREEEYSDMPYGKISFQRYCSDYLSDGDLVDFVNAELKHAPQNNF